MAGRRAGTSSPKNLKPALEGLKIVQLSDLHLHPYTQIEFVQQAVQTANALQPDLVVLTFLSPLIISP